MHGKKIIIIKRLCLFCAFSWTVSSIFRSGFIRETLNQPKPVALISRTILSTEATSETGVSHYLKSLFKGLFSSHYEYKLHYVNVDGESKKISLKKTENDHLQRGTKHQSHRFLASPFSRLNGRESSMAGNLHNLLTNPSITCKRMVRVGGRSCVGAYDGSKLVCLDNAVFPRPLDCIVYSFGVGNDFSFDKRMQDYGCEVHSFDHDDDHEVYDYRQGPNHFFHKSRIGVKTGYYKACEDYQHRMECDPVIRYQTMRDIRRMLRHEATRVDYLKIDIEGSEWLVLKDIIYNSTVLESAKQLAFEIHMDGLHNATLEDKNAALVKYLDVFYLLNQQGFEMAAYEPNGMNPEYEEIDGFKLSLYAEVLLLKRNK
ncbi:hypothetical protein SK128_002836 [Halocaridina rubra]|uniref:Methyltransferase domain-containing protein n=1 Tax=Halocaridina rubra TaxID=373956 RepID=A0AAN8XSW0_HALRR